MGLPAQPGGPQYTGGTVGRPESANLGDILERVLDRGVVVVGDIKVNLLDIELLTVKLRLLIASVETARELGIDWWQSDPWLVSGQRDLLKENEELRERVAALESREDGKRRALGGRRAPAEPGSAERDEVDRRERA